MDASEFNLAEGIRRNRLQGDFSFVSVCSAHPDVIAASLDLAEELDSPIIVEATSNQVNQFGGYTGMQPADFIAFVKDMAARSGCSTGRILFGGDHLGPQAWRDRPSEEAMAMAEDMVRSYVRAGFTKIHLDCSEGCRGEAAQLPDEEVAIRAARLARVCEDESGGAPTLSYVIGTEVPPPGGSRTEHAAIIPTDPARARRTIDVHRAAFLREGIADGWGRVRALVVQPGLEFGPAHIDHFDCGAPDRLSAALEDFPDMAFEAHSTDYQHAEVYPNLAARHFAVLKVGPALTYAYREAIYALSHLDGLVTGSPHISQVMDALMCAEPKFWAGHYRDADDNALRLMRHFAYADRIRYYWAHPLAQRAVSELGDRIDAAASVLTVPTLSQYFAADEIAWALNRRGRLFSDLIHAHIRTALRPYWVGGEQISSQGNL